MMRIIFLLFFLGQNLISNGQVENLPKEIRITSAFTSFPDTARAKGHMYDKVLYTAEEHYKDSSVLIVVPPDFKAGKKVDVIFWFHGWRNNIDSAAAYFELTKQFLASNRNAVLVIPETTKNAPDSYGGKLEQENFFKQLLQDVMNELKKKKITEKKNQSRQYNVGGAQRRFQGDGIYYTAGWN